MARKRFITSDMSIDEKIAEIAAENPVAALMWPWFITGFDDWGRMEAVPVKIKLSIFPAFPYTPKDIEEAIDLYDKHELVYRYEIDGNMYIAYFGFLNLQKQQYVRPSKFPDPDVNGPQAEEIKEYLHQCHTWPIRPSTPWMKYRAFVLRRDNYTCVYCGTKEKIGLDHIVPRSKGGSDTPDNLVAACFPCNRKKGARTPEQAGMVIRRDW